MAHQDGLLDEARQQRPCCSRPNRPHTHSVPTRSTRWPLSPCIQKDRVGVNPLREYEATGAKSQSPLKWEKYDRDPNFRLIYTSVGTFERNRAKFAIVGINPAGYLRHADSDNGHERPLLKKKYSAYLDDNWDQAGTGQSRFQRAVQGIAMILRGATPSEPVFPIWLKQVMR